MPTFRPVISLRIGITVDNPLPQPYYPIMASERVQRRIDRLLDQVEQAVDELDWDVVPELKERARIRRDQGYVARLSVRAVDRLFEASGGHALFDSSPMQRFHRDAHAASHHFGLSWETGAEEYGRMRLGLELKNPARL